MHAQFCGLLHLPSVAGKRTGRIEHVETQPRSSFPFLFPLTSVCVHIQRRKSTTVRPPNTARRHNFIPTRVLSDISTPFLSNVTLRTHRSHFWQDHIEPLHTVNFCRRRWQWYCWERLEWYRIALQRIILFLPDIGSLKTKRWTKESGVIRRSRVQTPVSKVTASRFRVDAVALTCGLLLFNF